MGESSVFRDGRVELLDGEVIAISPQNPAHASTVQALAQRLSTLIGDRFCIRCRLPIALDPWSEPEPDVAVCRQVADNYSREHPRPSEVCWLIEVADSSLSFDRGRKTTAYARAGIPELWIVDLVGRQVEVHVEPAPRGAYTRLTRFDAGAAIETSWGLRLRVDEILPPL